MNVSPRLAALVAALPLEPGMRVLEIGCGPGAAARAAVARLGDGHLVAIDRSARAIALARAGSAAEIASGRLFFACVAAEDFELELGAPRFDLTFGFRVGALDGRHPAAGAAALARIAAALAPGAPLLIDGGDPLRSLPLGPGTR
jgi:SAM-dependent methyltransferase